MKRTLLFSKTHMVFEGREDDRFFFTEYIRRSMLLRWVGFRDYELNTHYQGLGMNWLDEWANPVSWSKAAYLFKIWDSEQRRVYGTRT